MAIEFKFADQKQKDLYKRFGTNHYLGNPRNVDHVFLWTTFFRRNLHRLVSDYFCVRLHWYQSLLIYLMGICNTVVAVASRAAAKSFLVGLFACCMCVLYPGIEIVISAATKGQSRLIVSKKIKNELMGMSPMLKREIRAVHDTVNDTSVDFWNKSLITVVVANENSRGNRSNISIRDEFRMLNKKVDDSVITPMQFVRQADFMKFPEYESIPVLQMEPINIYLSSSWFDNGHWMWELVDSTANSMLNGQPVCLIALDESITLRHNIRTMAQMIAERNKIDRMTWNIEYLNMRVKERTGSFFTYSMILKNQRSKKPFYPRRDEDFRAHKKNIFDIPKQSDEVRIVACDMAFVQGEGNDNSSFSCIRALPESTHYTRDNSGGDVKVNHGYRRIVSYMEAIQGGETMMQARRIRQLYEDFGADYIVLDVRNAGLACLDLLSKVMYDEDRDIEYKPLSCMNNENLANRIQNPNAQPVIYAIEGSLKLNNDIAFSLRDILESQRIDFLESLNNAREGFLSNIEEYLLTDEPELQLWYERPFLESQLFADETSNLVYERAENTGLVRVHEQGNNRKDRYTSVSYGNYFISLLEQDLLSGEDDLSSTAYAPCVSEIEF